MSVAEMLNEVKSKFPDALSEDVMRHFELERPDTKLGNTVKYAGAGAEERRAEAGTGA